MDGARGLKEWGKGGDNERKREVRGERCEKEREGKKKRGWQMWLRVVEEEKRWRKEEEGRWGDYM